MEATLEKLLIAGVPSVLVVVATWWLNRKLESFKHDLLTKVHAKKLLFEKEMEFYEHLFRALTELRDPIAEFTATVISRPRDETLVQWEQNNYSAFSAAYNELYNAVLSYRPFYPEAIYSEAEKLLKTCYRRQNHHEIMISYLIQEHQDTPRPKDNKKVREDSEQVLEMTNQLIATVKSRIEKYELY